MATQAIPPFPLNSYVVVEVVDIDADGVTPDLVEPLTVGVVTGGGVVAAAVNPGNPRQVKITGLAAGSATVSVGAPGVPTAGLLMLTFTITALPNLSRIDYVGVVAGPNPV